MPRSPLLEPHLSLRNLAKLSLSTDLLRGGGPGGGPGLASITLPELGLGGSPLELDLLEFHPTFRPGPVYMNGINHASFRPNPSVLALFNPVALKVHGPTSFLITFGPSRGKNSAISRNAFHVPLEAADVMCGWTRLQDVTLFDLDLYITRNNTPSSDPATHEYFLYLPAPAGSSLVNVWWEMTQQKPMKPGSGGPGQRLLCEPVEYFAARRPLLASKVKQAFLVLPDDRERVKEKVRTDVPALIKIIAAVGQEGDA